MNNVTSYFGSHRDVYIVDTGILLRPADAEFEQYSNVYDKHFGYYDESQTYETSLAEAIRTAESEVSEGVVGTYAVISVSSRNFGDMEDNEIMSSSVKDESFPKNQVFYSLVKIADDIIVPNFVGVYTPDTLNKKTVSMICVYCTEENIGIVDGLYSPDNLRNYEYNGYYIKPGAIEFMLKPKMYSRLQDFFSRTSSCENIIDWINICALLNSEEIEYHWAMKIRDIAIRYGISFDNMIKFREVI